MATTLNAFKSKIQAAREAAAKKTAVKKPATTDAFKAKVQAGREAAAAKVATKKPTTTDAFKAKVQAGREAAAVPTKKVETKPVTDFKSKVQAAREKVAKPAEAPQLKGVIEMRTNKDSRTGRAGSHKVGGKQHILNITSNRRTGEELGWTTPQIPGSPAFETKEDLISFIEKFNKKEVDARGNPVVEEEAPMTSEEFKARIEAAREDPVLREQLQKEAAEAEVPVTEEERAAPTLTPEQQASLDAFKAKLTKAREEPEFRAQEQEKVAAAEAEKQRRLEEAQAEAIRRFTTAPITPTVPTETQVAAKEAAAQAKAESAFQAEQAAADEERAATDALLEFLQTTPEESSVERFKRLQTEAGRPALVTGRQETFKQIQRVQNLLKNLEQDIVERGKDVGITQAQARRLEAAERSPLTQQLEALNETLQLQNLQITDIDDQIERLSELGAQDRADELDRLKGAASVAGLTRTEQNILSRQIKQATEEAERVRTERTNLKKVLDDGLAEMRAFALEEGIISEAFQETVNEAKRRFSEGEDPQAILSGVAAAVSANPQFQRKIQADIARKEQLARAKSTTEESFFDAISRQIAEEGTGADVGVETLEVPTQDDITFLSQQLEQNPGVPRKDIEDAYLEAGLDANDRQVQQLLDAHEQRQSLTF